MPKIGDIIEAKVVKLLPSGAILSAGDSYDYFLPIKEAGTGYVKRMEDVVSEGETIKARITRSKKT
ncbi:S1 RNA-binding domain-containing protein [Bacillus megaterium]|nr:S1 RNA-binding domain-containing protein [Priestia megaterium]